jgi:hypothetical protein
MKALTLLFTAGSLFAAAPLVSDPADDFSKVISQDNVRQAKVDPGEPGGTTYNTFAVKSVDAPAVLVYALPEKSAQVKLSMLIFAKACTGEHNNEPPKQLLTISTADESTFAAARTVEAKFELDKPQPEEGYYHFSVSADVTGAKFAKISLSADAIGELKKDWWYVQLDAVEVLPAAP